MKSAVLFFSIFIVITRIYAPNFFLCYTTIYSVAIYSVLTQSGDQVSKASCLYILKPSGGPHGHGAYKKLPVFRMNDFQEGEHRLLTSQSHMDEIAAALEFLERG
jgi:hypothetical protein